MWRQSNKILEGKKEDIHDQRGKRKKCVNFGNYSRVLEKEKKARKEEKEKEKEGERNPPLKTSSFAFSSLSFPYSCN